MDVLSVIEEIQDHIFAYRVDALSNKMLSLVELLTAVANNFAVHDQGRLNTVLNVLLDSYEKKDYLLIADLLEYELKPLLVGICAGVSE